MMRLLFGYGNPGRGDDALGPLLIDRIQQCGFAQIQCLTAMQLLIEHAADLPGFDQILFVDADMGCAAPYQFSAVIPEKDDSYTSHALTPAALLFIYQQAYHHPAPDAFLLRIRGYRFELGNPLSEQAAGNLDAAVTKVRQWHTQFSSVT
ncbi:MAG: hydrogenase maturation protease [Nitrosomonas sp.]|nr:MAG: hydrogenase maturation protease [Nitrosomonas sp.]